MELTEDKLLYLWRMRETIFDNVQNKELIERFEWLNKLFAEIEETTVDYDNDNKEVSVNGTVLKDQNGEKPSFEYFACAKDYVPALGAMNGVYNMADKFTDHKNIILEIGRLMGGFDCENTMKEEYRIVSNTVKDGNDNGSLVSEGISRHPSSNLADNNYFFNVIETINQIKDGTFNTDASKFVLRYPQDQYYEDKEVAEQSQKAALKKRFPYKFFYAWTHRDQVIHLIGLKAYKNLVTQKQFQYIGDQEMDQPFDDFSNEKSGWKNYSDTIINLIPENERSENFISDLSKLLSIVLSTSVQLKNMIDLFDTGNHAIVLWGPPGTGKTFSAKGLVCHKLGISREKLNEYRLGNCKNPEKGAWDIVQFHPNYSYEDFIGGISPQLEADSLSYKLKVGIFKKMCDIANLEENKNKPFILIIDEINRADLSAVFGELMYALEYRNEKISIPNFEEPFVIPENIYLIGTMNSIDKSLATFDLALRRRFGFYKIMPDVNLLSDMLATTNLCNDSIKEFIKRCKNLNDKISNNQILQLGYDYQIGHAYFAKIKDFIPDNKDEQSISTFDLEKLWIYHLEPLLEEYIGNRMEDPSIKDEMEKMKNEFIRSL